MKRLLVLLAFTILSVNVMNAQNSPYPTGNIQLKIDGSFGKNSDWNKLSTTNESLYSAYYARPASFAIGSNGNIYVVNNIKKELQLFDSNGNFIKTLAKITDIAKYMTVKIAGILDNKYIVTENYNRLHIFNMDGSLFKLLYLDYPVSQVVPLTENIIAIYSNIVYPGDQNKQCVILKDIVTEKDIEIESKIDTLSKSSYTIKLDKQMVSISYPYSKTNFILNRINDDQLLVGFTCNDKLKIYSKEGQLISTLNTNIQALTIPDSVKTEFNQKIKSYLAKIAKDADFDKKTIDEMILPSKMPFFHSIQVDDHNNILVFLYTEGKATHTASIYSCFSNNGQYLGSATFNCDPHKLNVNPLSKCIHFGDKEIKAIIRDGEGKKSPFRLVKFNY